MYLQSVRLDFPPTAGIVAACTSLCVLGTLMQSGDTLRANTILWGTNSHPDKSKAINGMPIASASTPAWPWADAAGRATSTQ
jgi:hypothetical protein